MQSPETYSNMQPYNHPHAGILFLEFDLHFCNCIPVDMKIWTNPHIISYTCTMSGMQQHILLRTFVHKLVHARPHSALHSPSKVQIHIETIKVIGRARLDLRVGLA